MSPSVSIRLLLTQSDSRLVAYAQAGHERAFEALVQRYRRQLHGYCRRLLLSEERAEDTLQQALLQAWLALRDGAEIENVRPWLYRIVHNAAVNALKLSGYDYCTLNESLSGADAPQADLDRRIAVREALAGLAALPPMQREALLRTAVEGRTHQQVASDLGLSEPALRGLVYRARATLRAAAGAVVPPPLLSWALEAGTRGAPAAEGLAGLGAGGGAAGIAGLLVKGSAVAVTAGALAGGIVAAHAHRGATHSARAASPRSAASHVRAPKADGASWTTASDTVSGGVPWARGPADARPTRALVHGAGPSDRAPSTTVRSTSPRALAPARGDRGGGTSGGQSGGSGSEGRDGSRSSPGATSGGSSGSGKDSSAGSGGQVSGGGDGSSGGGFVGSPSDGSGASSGQGESLPPSGDSGGNRSSGTDSPPKDERSLLEGVSKQD